MKLTLIVKRQFYGVFVVVWLVKVTYTGPTHVFTNIFFRNICNMQRKKSFSPSVWQSILHFSFLVGTFFDNLAVKLPLYFSIERVHLTTNTF